MSVYRVLPGADNRNEEAKRSLQFVRSEMSKATMFADTLAKQLDHYNREHGQALSKADLRGHRLHDFVRSEHRELGARTWCALSSIRKSAATIVAAENEVRVGDEREVLVHPLVFRRHPLHRPS